MTMINLLLVLTVLSLGLSDQNVPISAAEYGLTIGDTNGTLHLQFFLDMMCPDSKQSYLSLKQVIRAININQMRIKLTYQHTPLSFHYFAWKIHQGYFYVLSKAGLNGALEYIDYIFLNQDRFAEQQWEDKTLTEFLDAFSKEIAIKFRVDQLELRKQLEFGSNSFNLYARPHWKYTTGSNGVSGAPFFNANGVRVDNAQNFRFNDWINFFKQYTYKK